MSASSAERPVGRALALTAALALLALPALGQQGPIRIAPLGAPPSQQPAAPAPSVPAPPVSAPVSPAPVAPTPRPSAPAAAPANLPPAVSPPAVPPPAISPPAGLPPATPANRPIEVDPLRPPELDALGLPDRDDSVFGGNQWENTGRTVAISLLLKLPARIGSATLQHLQTRLLSIAATPPVGTQEGVNLLALRLAKLAESADLRTIDDVLAAVPASRDDAGLARLRADQAFLGDRVEDACRLTEQQLAKGSDAYWQRNRVACQALHGDTAPAQLGVQLLREQNAEDTLLSVLVERMSGVPNAPLPADGGIAPAALALARAAKAELPEALFKGAQPRLLEAVARSEALPGVTRVAAAESAARWNVLGSDRLGRAYMAVEPSPTEAGDTMARRVPGARGRALLWRAVQGQQTPALRLELIRAALDSARKDDFWAPTARLYQPGLLALRPSPDLAPFAPDIARILYLTGAKDQAKGWLDLLRRTRGPEAESAATRLYAVAWLADSDNDRGPDERSVGRWAAAEKTAKPDESDGRIALFFGLVEGLGTNLDPGIWAITSNLPATPRQILPGPAAWLQMSSAAEGVRVGEATALILINRADKGWGPEFTALDSGVLSALRFLGLESEARNLAIESALGSGL